MGRWRPSRVLLCASISAGDSPCLGSACPRSPRCDPVRRPARRTWSRPCQLRALQHTRRSRPTSSRAGSNRRRATRSELRPGDEHGRLLADWLAARVRALFQSRSKPGSPRMTLTALPDRMTHRERLMAAMRGADLDRPPVSVWRHFPIVDMTAAGLADATVAYQKQFDWDLVKFMPTGVYSVVDYGVETDWIPNNRGVRTPRALRITHPDQWRQLPRLKARDGFLGQQNRALQLTVQQLGTDVPILQTVFSPLTTARKLAGDAVFQHLPDGPS